MAVDVGRVGIWSPSWLWAGREGEETVAELDEFGFGALWLGGAAGDLGTAENLLRVTKRMALASGIVNVWTEPVEETADAYHRVTSRYPGRFLLGIGAGHKELVERTTGQHYVWPYRKVVGYLDQLDEASPPVPAAGRALAALGPRMLELAAQRSAGAHPYLVTPDHTRWAREVVGTEPLLAPEQKVVLETERTRAREIARGTLSRYLTLPNYTSNLLRLGYEEEDFLGGGSDRLVDGLVAWGDVETVLSRLGEHHQAGADHVCLQVVSAEGADPREEYRLLAQALFT